MYPPAFITLRAVGGLRRGGCVEKGRRERLQGGGWVPNGVGRVKGRRNEGRSGKNIIWELEEKRIGGKGRREGEREETELEQGAQE